MVGALTPASFVCTAIPFALQFQASRWLALLLLRVLFAQPFRLLSDFRLRDGWRSHFCQAITKNFQLHGLLVRFSRVKFRKHPHAKPAD